MKRKGFTLIEMLIVVAIIGILAALLIPNAMAALQKAKQKGTLKDINTIATGLMDYVTDNGKAPEDQSGNLTQTSPAYTALSGFYVKVLPLNDQWGNPFQVFTGSNCSSNEWGIPEPADGFGVDEFMVGSNGRNGTAGDFTYNTQYPEKNFYAVEKLSDFNNEIVNWNGNLVIGPKTTGGGVAGTGT
jgi:type II secretion system protein G